MGRNRRRSKICDGESAHRLCGARELQVQRLAGRLSGRRLTLDVTPAAKEWLALTGFDPVYGARPLRRLIQSAIGDKLARGLIAGEITDGDRVLVDLDEAADVLRVSPERAAEAAGRPGS